MGITLIGQEGTERSDFFIKAAKQLQIPINTIDFPKLDEPFSFDLCQLAGNSVKIDPPELSSVYLDELNALNMQYTDFLAKLQSAPGARFLNSPLAISHTLDKLYCKQTLMEANISTPPCLAGIATASQLKQAMSETRIHSVFIKPRFGSGAAGIVAYRLNMTTGSEIAYTTSHFIRDRLVNTRKLSCIHDSGEIEEIINYVLDIGSIVEKWAPKASYAGKAFDIRAVWQFGKIEFAVARLSNGPITNLHLGGESVPLGQLGLADGTLVQIGLLCSQTMGLFPGLECAGIDILLESSTNEPNIIEINGQGDLLYLDIFNENKIYNSQVFFLSKK